VAAGDGDEAALAALAGLAIPLTNIAATPAIMIMKVQIRLNLAVQARRLVMDLPFQRVITSPLRRARVMLGVVAATRAPSVI
jgi:hypothetical protein